MVMVDCMDKITTHAKHRALQAGISLLDAQLIVKHGDPTPGNTRGRICYTTNTKGIYKHLKELKEKPSLTRILRLLEMNVIVSRDGWIITAYKDNVNSRVELNNEPFRALKGG